MPTRHSFPIQSKAEQPSRPKLVLKRKVNDAQKEKEMLQADHRMHEEEESQADISDEEQDEESKKKRKRKSYKHYNLPAYKRKPTGYRICPDTGLRRMECPCHQSEYCQHNFSKNYCVHCPGKLMCPTTLCRISDCKHCAERK